MLLRNILAINLLRIRTERGWKQSRMAECVEVSLRFYQELENGENAKKTPSFETLEKMLSNLDISPNQLLMDPREIPKEDLSKTYLIKALEQMSEEMKVLKAYQKENKALREKVKSVTISLTSAEGINMTIEKQKREIEDLKSRLKNSLPADMQDFAEALLKLKNKPDTLKLLRKTLHIKEKTSKDEKEEA